MGINGKRGPARASDVQRTATTLIERQILAFRQFYSPLISGLSGEEKNVWVTCQLNKQTMSFRMFIRPRRCVGQKNTIDGNSTKGSKVP